MATKHSLKIKNPALLDLVNKVGTQTGLANAINEHLGKRGKVRQGHVWWWLFRSGKVPTIYARALSAKFGVPLDQLNEDFGDLPRPAAQPPEAAPGAPEPPAEGVEAPCPLQRAPDAILWSDEAA